MTIPSSANKNNNNNIKTYHYCFYQIVFYQRRNNNYDGKVKIGVSIKVLSSVGKDNENRSISFIFVCQEELFASVISVPRKNEVHTLYWYNK